MTRDSNGVPAHIAIQSSAAGGGRVPVSIITGFLGSGKTTLLNHLLQDPALSDAVVIINEFGEVGIDHLLVATPSENMVLLKSGCLCCTVRGDLVETLADLRNKRRDGAIPAFSKAIVETTGLADPVPIIQTIATDDDLSQVYRLENVVTLVDAVHGMNLLGSHFEAVKQAAVSDVLLITKTDLADPGQLAILRDRLIRINPGAEICEVVRGVIASDQVFRGGIYDPATKGSEVERWLREEGFQRSAMAVDAGHHGHGHHGHDVNRHDDHVRSFSFYYDQPILRAGLVVWLNMLADLRGADLLRVKGILNVEGEPVVVHAVQTIIHEPVVLSHWPSEERRSRIVMIVRDISRQELERTFEAFQFSVNPVEADDNAFDPASYSRFMQAAAKFRH